MSLAIKFGDTTDTSSLSGFIYFDVVTDYSRKLSGKLTSHPIDAGALISDHFVSENRKFSIKGVITGADISGMASSISIDDKIPLNTNVQPISITVSDQGSDLYSFLPASISQFLGITTQQVIVDESSRVDYKAQVWNIFDKLFTALVFDNTTKRLKNQMSIMTLYELDGNKLEKQYENLVMLDFSVDEDENTGDGMFFTMSLESANFVSLEKVELPKDVAASLKKAAASKSSKAKTNSDAKKVDATTTDSPTLRPKPTNAQQQADLDKRLAELLPKK